MKINRHIVSWSWVFAALAIVGLGCGLGFGLNNNTPNNSGADFGNTIKDVQQYGVYVGSSGNDVSIDVTFSGGGLANNVTGSETYNYQASQNDLSGINFETSDTNLSDFNNSRVNFKITGIVDNQSNILEVWNNNSNQIYSDQFDGLLSFSKNITVKTGLTFLSRANATIDREQILYFNLGYNVSSTNFGPFNTMIGILHQQTDSNGDTATYLNLRYLGNRST